MNAVAPLQSRRNIPRGLAILGAVFLAMGLVSLSLKEMERRQREHTVAANEVTRRDFSAQTQQLRLSGVLREQAGQVKVHKLTEMSARLVGGTSANVFVPLTGSDWSEGDPVPVYVVSPTLHGVRPGNDRGMVEAYLASLRAYEAPMQVTLVTEEVAAQLQDLELQGLASDSLFVWPDHVESIKYGTPADGLPWFRVYVFLALGIAGLVLAALMRRRRSDTMTDLAPGGGGMGDGSLTVAYHLAHVSLRQLALSNPVGFLGMLASPNARDFLSKLVDSVAEDLVQEPSFSADSILIHQCMVKSFPCVVLEMPKPDSVAEAYLVAVVAETDLEAERPAADESVPARYFTLEKGLSFDEVNRTVLCEWAENRDENDAVTGVSHLNRGEGPHPTVEGFVQALEQQYETHH